MITKLLLSGTHIIDKINNNSLLSFSAKCTVCLGGFLIIDRMLRRTNIRKQTKWYLIHTIGNGLITTLSLKDMISTTIDPLQATIKWDHSHSLTNLSTYPVVIMSSIHLYHIILYFKELTSIDWIHHLANSGLVGSICAFYINSPIVNHGLFFMCGLPGGIDYLMLSINDLGIIDRMTEKRINRYLNMYLRLPGILFNCYAGLFNYLYQSEPYCHLSIGSIIFILNMWNAIYFAQRVVENYGYSSAINNNKLIE